MLMRFRKFKKYNRIFVEKEKKNGKSIQLILRF